MRLREPFQGYKLSSGHALFHLAFIAGSRFAVNYILEKEVLDEEGNHIPVPPEAKAVLFQLNLAHILTPIFNLVSMVADHRGYGVISKISDMISIFQYQATIFMAQNY